MSHPAPDFQSHKSRWLMEALSLDSAEAVLAHLCRGWLEFTSAVAVFLCEENFAGVSGCFLREGESPRFLPNLSAGHPLEFHLQSLLPELSTANLAGLSSIPLEWEARKVGGLALWSGGESLSAEFNWLTEASARILAKRLRIEDQLQSDKLEALGEFAAGAGHEINNPVATISGRVQGLLQSETDLERRRQLLTIGSQALRIRDMIGDTMLFARPPEPEPEFLALNDILPLIIEPLDAELKLANFRCELPEPVSLFADRTQLAVVITELLRNSLEWRNIAGGHVHLSATALETPTGRMAQIVIEDDGESFPEEHLPHVFDPFFSGRQAGRGLGFGLPKCWRIVSNHHGRIGIASLPDAGTRITVIWPAYDFLPRSS